ncbi:DUF4190 domain-containing protein [Streptomyces sp. NPDC090108]|uniref:DUF4190 domain-containing protein n=1 Tax=Streptomyces sp. NPDC090108 TaxID=3365947 RepID=UPI00382407F5
MSIPPAFGPQPPQGPYPPSPPPQQPHQQGAFGPPSHPQAPQNPFGVPGVPGYRPWAQEYSPYSTSAPFNDLAIASFVMGVLCCLPGVGLVLGLISLRRMRERGERGRGLAISGALLSGAGLLLGMLMLVTGSESYVWKGLDGSHGGPPAVPVKGECFDQPGGRLSGGTEGVDRVPCSGAHDGEVFGDFDLKGGASYPGDRAVAAAADKHCYGLQDAYAMDRWAVPDGVGIYYLTPDEDSWLDGERTVTCVFGRAKEGADLTGSLREDATVLDHDQIAYLKAAHVFNAAMDAAPDTEYVDDDLPGHKAWAGRMSAAIGEQARMLRGRTWPAGARAPVASLAGALDGARVEWAKAAKADGAEAFYRHYEAGMRLLDVRRSVPVRKALSLRTTPPLVVKGGGSGGSGDGGGDGGPGGHGDGGDGRGGGDGSDGAGMQV